MCNVAKMIRIYFFYTIAVLQIDTIFSLNIFFLEIPTTFQKMIVSYIISHVLYLN